MLLKKLLSQVEQKTNAIEELVNTLNDKYCDLGLAEHMTPKQVCETLRISLRTLQSLRHAGKIEYYHIDRKILFHPEHIRKYMGKNGGLI